MCKLHNFFKTNTKQLLYCFFFFLQKSSFSKFDALQKKNLLHVRSSDSSKAQEKFSVRKNCRTTFIVFLWCNFYRDFKWKKQIVNRAENKCSKWSKSKQRRRSGIRIASDVANATNNWSKKTKKENRFVIVFVFFFLCVLTASILIKVTRAPFIANHISRHYSHRKLLKMNYHNVSDFNIIYLKKISLYSSGIFLAKQNRHKLIICENEPVELPPDVVRG